MTLLVSAGTPCSPGDQSTALDKPLLRAPQPVFYPSIMDDLNATTVRETGNRGGLLYQPRPLSTEHTRASHPSAGPFEAPEALTTSWCAGLPQLAMCSAEDV
jgi:hypothetical protein